MTATADRLSGRSALVTGGGGGIGAACARRLAADGATVTVADLDLAAAQRVAAELPGARAVHVDVTDAASADAAVAAALEATGTLDIAVNSAGIGGPRLRIHEYTTADWRRIMAVNLDGIFECMRAELAPMVRQGSGTIVNISSILGSAGWATSAAYTSSKHAVEGLTKAAALEYATNGIRINAVAPGFIGTELIRTRMTPEELAALGGKHPVDRIGEPDEVAAVVAFLAGDEASFVTGSTYRADGGYLSIAGMGN